MKIIRILIYITVALSLLTLSSCRNRRSKEVLPEVPAEVVKPSAEQPAREQVDKEVQKPKKSLADKIRIHSFEGVSGNLSDGMILKLRVVNETGYNITLTDCRADGYLDGGALISATLKREVVVPRRSDSVIEVPVGISLLNPIGAFSAMALIQKKDFSRFEAALEGGFEVLSRRYPVNVPRTSVPQILKLLGYEE